MPDANDHPLSRRTVILGAAAAAATAGTLITTAGTASAQPTSSPAATPTSGATPSLGGLPDWLGTILDVGTVAAQVVGSLVGTPAGVEAPPYLVGDVGFYPKADGELNVRATNVSGVNAGLSYSLTQSSPDTSVSVYQPLPPGKGYDCTEDLRNYRAGQVYVAAAPDIQLADGPMTRLVNFAARGLTIGSVITVVGGLSVSVVKTSDNYVVHVSLSDPPDPFQITVSATGPSGNTVRTEWTRSSTGLADVFDIPLPSGVDLDPVVQSLQLQLYLDPAGLDVATAARRALLTSN